jgi:conjugative relaxase-like TrwC/TraI family protein
MLTLKNTSSHQAIDYYSQSYYDAFQTRWYGTGAEALGLVGSIQTQETFTNICNGLAPDGSNLGRERSRAAIDCTFSAPKSVSLCALVGGDKRLEVAHRIAVEKTLAIMESRYSKTRMRMDGRHEAIKTGNLVVAQFDHIESRELDPHLHTHALLMNLTQAENNDWYSLWNEGIYQNKKHIGAIYQAYLAGEVEKLGYEIEQRAHGQFEIKGYEREDLVEFSKRRQQIISETGGVNATWKTREDAWSRTRQAKLVLPPEELKQRWREEVATLGIEIVKPTVKKRYTEAALTIQHLDDAIAHCSQRSVEFSIEDVEKFILNQRLTNDVNNLTPLIEEKSNLLTTPDGSFTTLQALKREKATVRIMERGKGVVDSIATNEAVDKLLEQSTLNQGQKQAIELAATTNSRVVAWQGVAGAGKTYTLKQLKAVADVNGYEVKAFAPSAQAAKVLGEELGIEANTVARKLVSERCEEVQNQVWVVDEAGLLGAEDALELLRRSEQEGARVILVGDSRQLSSVAAGNPFKSLQEAGMETAFMNQAIRQRNEELKLAVNLIACGKVQGGFEMLEGNDNITEVSDNSIVENIAKEYMAIPVQERAKTLVLAGTNERRLEITQAIREGLQAEGAIGVDAPAVSLKNKNLTTVEMKYAHNFEVGDVVVPLYNYKRRELVKGEHYTVKGKQDYNLVLTSRDGKELTVDAAFEKALYKSQDIQIAVGDKLKWTKNDHTLERRNGQEFTVASIEWDKATIQYTDGKKEVIDLQEAQHFDHNLVTTTFSSQGKTAERVLWAVDFTASKENFYVATSRARNDLKIFTDNKAELLKKALESRTNLNPSDLLKRQKLLEKAKTDVVQHYTKSFLKMENEKLLSVTGYIIEGLNNPEGEAQKHEYKQEMVEALKSPKVQERISEAYQQQEIQQRLERSRGVEMEL